MLLWQVPTGAIGPRRKLHEYIAMTLQESLAEAPHIHPVESAQAAGLHYAQAKKNVVRAIERVAKRLGNTPSICRKCYVHPAVLDAYLDGSLIETLQQRADQEFAESLRDLRPEEATVMRLLIRLDKVRM
jgi:DNA topoisomerase IB